MSTIVDAHRPRGRSKILTALLTKISVFSLWSCQDRASRNAPLWGSSAKNLGTGKRPRLVKLTRNIIKRQSIFLWRHAGRSTGLLSTISEGLALGQPMWEACLRLQLKGKLCLEKELWVTSRSDACGLAQDTREKALCYVYKLYKVMLTVI